MGHKIIFGEKCKQSNQRNSETRKGEPSFLDATHCLDLIHIPIYSNEDTKQVTKLWGVHK